MFVTIFAFFLMNFLSFWLVMATAWYRLPETWSARMKFWVLINWL